MAFAINGTDSMTPILEALGIPYKGQMIRKVTIIYEVDAAVIIEVERFMDNESVKPLQTVIDKYKVVKV